MEIETDTNSAGGEGGLRSRIASRMDGAVRDEDHARRSSARRMVDFAWSASVALALHVMFFVTPMVPKRLLYGFADRAGAFLYRAFPRYRKLIESNLEYVFGGEKTEEEIRRIAVETYKHQLKNVIDFMRTSRMSNSRLCGEIGVVGAENLVAALEKGRGVMLVTAHFGSFLTCAARISAGGVPLTIIYRRQTKSPTERYLRRLWESRGITMTLKGTGGGGVYDELLARNAIVTTAIDQDAGLKGMFIPFLGRQSSAFYGWMAIALRTGAAVVPTICIRDETGENRALIMPEVELVRSGNTESDIRTNLIRVNAFLEEQIRLRPEQWLWFTKRWKTRPGDVGEKEKT